MEFLSKETKSLISKLQEENRSLTIGVSSLSDKLDQKTESIASLNQDLDKMRDELYEVKKERDAFALQAQNSYAEDQKDARAMNAELSKYNKEIEMRSHCIELTVKKYGSPIIEEAEKLFQYIVNGKTE